MQSLDECLRLYAVTDRAWVGEKTLLQQVEEALQGGATLVQLREKEMDADDFLTEAVEIKRLCSRYGVPLIINDRVDIALKCGADGVHVGQHDEEVSVVRARMGKGAIVGATAKTVEQALAVQAAGADYLGCGAVFGTATKTDAQNMDFALLRKICGAVHIPVVAIGGINLSNVERLAGTGISGAAIVSGIFAAKDIGSTCRQLRAVIDRMCEQQSGGKTMKMPTALTIAGSDSSGGAGIQADIKTMTANGVYAMSAVAALTAQNTTGVFGILNTPPDFLEKQLDCVFTDIVPDAVKIGMVSSAELIETVVRKLKQYHARNIVVDPVMVSTSGSWLIAESAIDALKRELLPLADLITPNIPEAEVLSGEHIATQAQMQRAAERISDQYGCAVLLKGGHNINDANDLLVQAGSIRWFCGRRIDNPNTHGTGCTLSSAIAANLAKGYAMQEAIESAKAYLSDALSAMLDLGTGQGPMNHMAALHGAFVDIERRKNA